MTFQKLEIRDFQNHASREVEFDESSTTIIGTSDVGKSAILRALRWPCLNVPQGDGFIREGSKGAESKITFDGNQQVTRKRGSDGDNTYHLNGQEYRAFGFSVPDPISKALAVDHINFSGQHDAPFWFSLSPGEVSREINHIVDLGIIDESLSSIGQKVRQQKEVVEISRQRLGKVKDQRDALEWVVDADEDLQNVEYAQKQFEHHTDIIRRIGELALDIRATGVRRDVALATRRDAVEIGQKYLQIQKVVAKIETLQGALKSVQNQKSVLDRGAPDFGEIERLHGRLQTIAQKLITLATTLKSVEDLKKVKRPPSTEELDSTVALYNKVKASRDSLETCRMVARGLKVTLEYAEKSKKDSEQLLHDQTEGRCPICGSVMS